jgi:TolB protein
MQNPSFSPDSARILFTNFTAGYSAGFASVGTVPAAGGSPTMLLPADAQNVSAPGSWNTAVDQIVVSSDMGGPLEQIYRLDPRGNSPPQIVATPAMRAKAPSLSPDGQWIVFEAHSASGTGNDPGSIWKVRIDGTEATHLTPNSVDAREPSWSPKGDRILYQATSARGGADIFTIDPSGRSLVNVTNGGTSHNVQASFSPDGSAIVYASDAAGDSLASLYVISAGRGTPKRVTFGPGYDGAPSWSPDGRCIAFETSTQDPDGSSGTTIAVVPAL